MITKDRVFELIKEGPFEIYFNKKYKEIIYKIGYDCAGELMLLTKSNSYRELKLCSEVIKWENKHFDLMNKHYNFHIKQHIKDENSQLYSDITSCICNIVNEIQDKEQDENQTT